MDIAPPFSYFPSQTSLMMTLISRRESLKLRTLPSCLKYWGIIGSMPCVQAYKTYVHYEKSYNE